MSTDELRAPVKQPSHVHRPTVCMNCRTTFLAATFWLDGIRTPVSNVCRDCDTAEVLF